MFKTVLFPIDHSREAVETANKAIQLAKNHQSHIIMLSILPPERPEMENSELVTSLLEKVQEQIELAGLTCEILKKEGNPAFVICDIADDLEVDVIVMGTRGINMELDAESTASRVIQLAPCPVLVVP